MFRAVQNGLVQHYALAMLIGVFLLIGGRPLAPGPVLGAQAMDFFRDHLLSIITYTPLRGRARPAAARLQGATTTRCAGSPTCVGVLGFLVSLPLWFWFDRGTDGVPVRGEGAPGSRPSASSTYFGVDGISALLILLTTLLGLDRDPVAPGRAITDRVRQYYVFLLLLQTGMLGVFCALDMFLFYVFWEVMLVPMYFLIGIWGGARRLYAAIKFFLYTLVGSVVMLLGILALYFHSQEAARASRRPAPST